MAGVLSTFVMTFTLYAQQREKFTDFRGKGFSTEDLERALSPTEMHPRGVPQTPSLLPPERVSVAFDVLYEFNSNQILSKYYVNLDKLGEVLKRRPEYRLQIEGHTDNVGSEDYNQRLSQRRAASVKQYLMQHFTLQLVPWPFCEVIELLEPFKQRAEEQGFGLAVGFKKGRQGSPIVAAAGTPPVYSVGAFLVIEVKAPLQFESHVYVDYYDTGGNVGHLLPNASEKKNVFGRSTSLMVGHPDGPAPWQISPPLGQDLVTVIASNLPLFPTPKLDSESAKSYLNELRQALNSASKSAVAATFSFIAIRNP
jgi:hypothetical protein